MSADRETKPEHWHQHTPTRHEPFGLRLGQEVLNGLAPQNPAGERYIHICGGCGHWLTAVHGGYFNNSPHRNDISNTDFGGMLKESLCPNCNSALFRRSCIVAPHTKAKELELTEVEKFVKNKNDSLFWSSDVGSRHTPADLAIELPLRGVFEDYHARCPSCGVPASSEDTRFDFHHWDYQDDVGCQLCRECHSEIHRGLTASEQNNATGDDWRKDAIRRLFEITQRNGLEFDDGWLGHFTHRFNIPQVSTVKEVLESEVNR